MLAQMYDVETLVYGSNPSSNMHITPQALAGACQISLGAATKIMLYAEKLHGGKAKN